MRDLTRACIYVCVSEGMTAFMSKCEYVKSFVEVRQWFLPLQYNLISPLRSIRVRKNNTLMFEKSI